MYNKINKINRLLNEAFGIPKRSKKLPDPVDLLIATILSQNTNDKNSYQAYSNLKKQYKSWEDVASQPLAKLEITIKSAGLAKQKSRTIKDFLASPKNKREKIDLDYLIKLTNDEIIAELTSTNGIGVKTAACVLLFSLDSNICPVDTHVHRTLNRIGLVQTKSPEKTFNIINKHLPGGIAHQFHTNLIRLGREICKPAKPKCAICPLLHICRYDGKNLEPVSVQLKNDFMLLDEIHKPEL
jgi:endonuclease-3